VVTYSFRDTISFPMAVGLFLWHAWLPGTLCVTNSMNRRLLRTVSDRYLRLVC